MVPWSWSGCPTTRNLQTSKNSDKINKITKEDKPDGLSSFCINLHDRNRKGEHNMKQVEKIYMISDAAKQVKVEAHVLRYWEEELELPV